jgi:hypothetical protein
MKKLNLFIFIVTIILFSSVLFAQDQAEITIEKMEICSSVENRQPVGVDSVFSKDVGQLYFFTKLSSIQDTSAISHVWFYNDKQMAKVDLTLKAKTWRTWSSKNILSDWIGEWRVEVHTASGEVISKKSFKVE